MRSEGKISEAESQIEVAEPIVNQLLTAIARQRGVIAAAAEATKLQIADAAAGHDAHSGGGTTVGLNFAAQSKQTSKCTITKETDTPNFATQPNFEQLTELKLTAETDIGKHLPTAKATITSSGSCSSGSGKQHIAQALASCQLAVGSTTDWAYTSMSEHSSSAATKLYKGDQRNQGCAEELDDSKIQDYSQKKLAKAICNYLKLNVKTLTPLAKESSEPLAVEPIVLKTVRNCDPDFATIENALDSSKNKVLKDYITDAYTRSQEFSQRSS
uniref:Variant surface glycoprotein 1125.5636 n=1 Tax=Trypanosoma brucei TaxID=5691 RepID=A0A1J0RCL4_9TRYP|nr:variant surface glycoprotein 1125.5636 [Trypanosoma brucei]